MRGTALAPLDYVVLAIVTLALLRGLLRGLLRESFSIASLGLAVIVVRLFYGEVAEWLIGATDGGISAGTAPWAAGALLTIGTIGAMAVGAKLLRRGAKAAGLGWADRAGGALLGAAEGVLIAAVGLGVTDTLIGREHPVLARSQSLVAFESLERMAREGEWPELPEVALGPERSD